MAKYKATGCARFFIFLVIFLPIAYFGAQYLMDNGYAEGLKDKIEEVTGVSADEPSITTTTLPSNYDNAQVEKQIKDLIAKVKQQETKISEQAKTIDEQKAIIQRLQDMRSSQDQTTQQSPAQSDPKPKQEDKKDGASLEELLKEAEKVIKNN